MIRDQIAKRWAAWLRQALADHEPPMSAAELARASGGALDTGKITHWTNGDNTANPESAALVAKLLHTDPAEALRAAGHGDLVDALTSRDPVLVLLDSVGRPDVTEAMAREYLEGLEAVRARTREMADRVKRDQEAASG
jgi:hypothetical protein